MNLNEIVNKNYDKNNLKIYTYDNSKAVCFKYNTYSKFFDYKYENIYLIKNKNSLSDKLFDKLINLTIDELDKLYYDIFYYATGEGKLDYSYSRKGGKRKYKKTNKKKNKRIKLKG